MKVRVTADPFDPWDELRQHQARLAIDGQFGATACFIGSMRDFNEAEKVESMSLEYYPGMTEKHIEKICMEAGTRWSLLEILVIHRVGTISISDPIVLIAVWSSHRGDALDACRYIIEDLKSRAPFWKKEKRASGEAWVEGNTDGYLKDRQD